MKHILLFALCASLLVSCSGSSKVKNITEFTTKLSSESSRPVRINPETTIQSFGNQLDYIKRHSTTKVKKPTEFKTKQFLSFSGKLLATPLLDNDDLYYITQKGLLTCFDIRAKKVKWENAILPKNTKLASATLSISSKGIIVTADLYMYSFDKVDGTMVNKIMIDDIARDYPAIFEDKLYLRTVNNKFSAYSLSNLSQLWHNQTWSDNVSTRGLNSPIVTKNIAISGFSSGQIIASDTKDGSEVWQISLLSDYHELIGSSPVDVACQSILENESLYLSGSDGYFFKIDINSGSIKWKKRIEDVVSMAKSKDIFLTNNARQIAAISEVDGSVLWASDLAQSESIKKPISTSFTAPLITNHGIFVFSEDGNGYLVHSDNGNIDQHFSIPIRIFTLVVFDETIMIFNEKGAYLIY